MNILQVQFNKVSGPDAVNTHKIEFVVDDSQRESLKCLYDYRKGESLLMVLFNVESEGIEDINEETPNQMKRRFQKRMHALINAKASEHSKTPEEIKDIVKKYLIKKGYMKKSSSELNIKGYAVAIHYLTSEF